MIREKLLQKAHIHIMQKTLTYIETIFHGSPVENR